MFKRKLIFICFTGIDGSGKTTFATSLNDFLIKEGIDSVYVWGRREPFLLKLPVKLVKKCLFKEKGKIEGEGYYAMKGKRDNLFKNKIVSCLWINYSLFEYLILFYIKTFLPNRKREVLICDRYLYDAIVDMGLNCSVSDAGSFFDKSILKIFPKPDCLYFISVSAELGASRKKDGTSIDYLRDRVPYYEKIADRAKAIKIDGSLPLAEIKTIIQDYTKGLIKRDG